MYPLKGVYALDAVMSSYSAISTLRQPIRPYEQIHGVCLFVLRYTAGHRVEQRMTPGAGRRERAMAFKSSKPSESAYPLFPIWPRRVIRRSSLESLTPPSPRAKLTPTLSFCRTSSQPAYCALPLTAPRARLGALYISLFSRGPYIVSLGFIPQNTAGHTKKVVLTPCVSSSTALVTSSVLSSSRPNKHRSTHLA